MEKDRDFGESFEEETKTSPPPSHSTGIVDTSKINDHSDDEEFNYGDVIFGDGVDELYPNPLTASVRRIIYPKPEPLSKVLKRVIGFRHVGGGVFYAEPMLIFRPSGLMCWNAPDQCMISQCLIGNTDQILVSCDPIPAKFYSMAKSYEQLKHMVEEEGYEPPSWGDYDSMTPGMRVQLRCTINGYCDWSSVLFAMWGQSVCSY